MATKGKQQPQDPPRSTEHRRTSLRGAEDAIFDLVYARTTTEQWSEWLQAPLEHAAGSGNLDLVARLQGAGARGSGLHAALRCGQVALARELLQRGACTKEKDGFGDTPLHLAAASGDDDIVSLLLQQGSPVDALGSKGRTALHLSAERGSLASAVALVAAGADVTLRCGDEDESALDLAAGGGHVEVLSALVEHGVDVNARDSKGCTALHAAAMNNKVCTIDTLMQAGANADVQGGKHSLRWTPLLMACERGSSEAVVALLNHGADVHTLGKAYAGGSPNRCSALYLAAYHGSIFIVNVLLAAGARVDLRESRSGDTALDAAASMGHVEIVKTLIKHGSRVDAVDSAGRTALFKAARFVDDVAVIDALVEAGARVDGIVDNSGMTPLHLAASGGFPEVIVSLLRHGARVGVRDNGGETPLHAACWLGCPAGIPALTEHGADVNERTNKGRTPLSLAAQQDDREAMSVLLDAGADIDAPADFGDGPPPIVLAAAHDTEHSIRLLAHRGADVNAADTDGATALHRAAEHNKVGNVDALLAAAAKIESKDKHARTPLIAAFRSAFHRWKEEGEDISDAEEFAAMIALLKHGADADARDSEGSESLVSKPTSDTLLHYCAGVGSPLSVVEALVDAGANVDARDEKERTPLHVAIEQGHLEMFRALLLHGADTDAQDPDSRTVLHKAAAAESNGVAYVDDLISAGAAVRIKDKQGRTPLHIAAKNRRLDVMRALLRSGADIALVDNRGRTALHLAVASDGYGMEAADVAKAVDLLLRWGADEEAADSSSRDGKTPALVWMRTVARHNVAFADASPSRLLLFYAPANRTWRRRGWLMLCRAFPDRVELRAEHSGASKCVSRSVRARCGAGSSEEIVGSAYGVQASSVSSVRVAPSEILASDGLSKLVAKVVGLHEEGVFRTIMGFV